MTVTCPKEPTMTTADKTAAAWIDITDSWHWATSRVEPNHVVTLRSGDGYTYRVRLAGLTSEEQRTIGTTWGVDLDPRKLRQDAALLRRQMSIPERLSDLTMDGAASVQRGERGELASVERRLRAVVAEGL